MLTLKRNTNGEDCPENWKFDDSGIEKRVALGKAWSIVPQYVGVYRKICQPELLAYGVSKGTYRDRS